MHDIYQAWLRIWPLWAGIAAVIFAGIGAPVFFYFLIRKRGQAKGRKSDDFGSLCYSWGVAITVISPFWVFTGGLVVYVPAQSVFVRPVGVVYSFDKETYLVASDYRLKGAAIESYAEKRIMGAINSSPITANPEVRTLILQVELRARGTLADYSQYRHSQWAKNPDKQLQYWLWEFEQQHHGQLIQFHNPEDEGQQKRFQQMIKQFLGPQMDGQGVYLQTAYFRRQ